jgi:hypothetical protein
MVHSCTHMHVYQHHLPPRVSQVQPFRYTLLLWASGLGWLVFGEVPDAPTVVGSALLVCAGYCSVQIEHKDQGTQKAQEAFGERGVVSVCTDPSKVLV